MNNNRSREGDQSHIEFSINEQQSMTSFWTSRRAGVKCLVAILSLENVLLKGKMRKLEQKNALLEIERAMDKRFKNESVDAFRQKLMFYQERVLELEILNEKLELKSNKENIQKFSNLKEINRSRS